MLASSACVSLTGTNWKILRRSILQTRTYEKFAVQFSEVSHRTRKTAAVGSLIPSDKNAVYMLKMVTLIKCNK